MADEAEMSVSIKFEGEKAHSLLDTLGQEADKPTPDRLAGGLADMVVREYINSLNQNDSRVTGTAERSIESRHMGTGKYGVYIASYLDQVDQGTSASERDEEVQGNSRLIAAAHKYGMSPYALARAINQRGTRAYPFKKQAIETASSKAGDVAREELQELQDKLERAKR